jgi:hypothetical protein
MCRKHVVRSCEGGQRGAWDPMFEEDLFMGGSEKLDVESMLTIGPYHKYRPCCGWFGGDGETKDVCMREEKRWLQKDVCVREGMVGEGCVCDGRYS